MTHGQCDARPTVTFPAAGHHCPLSGEQLAQCCYVKVEWPGVGPMTFCVQKRMSKLRKPPVATGWGLLLERRGVVIMCRFYLTSCILCKFVYDACANVNSWTSPVFCARRSSTSGTCRPTMPNWNAKTWHWRQRLSGRKVYWQLLTIIFLLWWLIFSRCGMICRKFEECSSVFSLIRMH